MFTAKTGCSSQLSSVLVVALKEDELLESQPRG